MQSSSVVDACGAALCIQPTEESPANDDCVVDVRNDATTDTTETNTIHPSDRVAVLQLLAASLVPDIREYMREQFAINKLALERRIAAEERHHVAVMAAEERRLANEERHQAAIMAVEELRVSNEEQHRRAMRAAIQHDIVAEQQYKAVARAGEQQRRADERNARVAEFADEQASRRWTLIQQMGTALPPEEMQRQMFHLIGSRPSQRHVSKAPSGP